MTRRLATAGQRSVWRAAQTGGGAALHLSRVLRLTGAVPIDAIMLALREVGESFPPLSIAPVEEDGELYLEDGGRGVPIPATSVDDVGEQELTRFVSLEFGLDGSSAVRALLNRQTNAYELYFVAHHLVVDGSTMDAVINNVLHTAVGVQAETPRPITQTLPESAGDELSASKIWQSRPTESWSRTAEGLTSIQFNLPDPQQIVACAKQHSTTVARIALACFAVVAHSLSDSEVVTITTPVDIRSRADRRSWGMGVNSIPVTSRAPGDSTLGAVLSEVEASFKRSLRGRNVALTDWADHAGVRMRSDGSSPLTDYEFNIVNQWETSPALENAGLHIEPLTQKVAGAQYDLSLSAIDGGIDSFELLWQVRGDNGREVANLANNLFRNALSAMTTAPATPLADLNVVGHDLASGVASPIDRRTATERVRSVAIRNPGSTAVVTASRRYSYSDLWKEVSRRVDALQALNVAPGDRIAVHLDRGFELVSTMLAIWSLTAVYVPIDRNNPSARVAQMIRSTAPRVLVTTGSSDSVVSEAVAAEGGVCSDLSGGRQEAPSVRPLKVPHDRWPTYVMFTSGSTGMPKALEIHAAGFSNHLDEMIRFGQLDHEDVFAQLAPLGFDVHIWQLIAPLVTGGVLRICSPEELRDPLELARVLNEEKCTVLQAVPAYLEQWCSLALAHPGGGALSLRLLFVTGESFATELAIRLRKLAPNASLVNAYGPAEASDDVTLHEVCADDLTAGGVIPIGRPIANCVLEVVDQWGRARPNGWRGELVIGGVAVGNGYLDADSRPAFISRPRPSGGFVYRTGDICSQQQGVFKFHGRVDHQVKLGGRRVELEEIEAICLEVPGVASAAVCIAATDESQTLVAALSGEGIDDQKTRSVLSNKLPSFMIPARFIHVDSLPVTSNGKVDREKLEQIALQDLYERNSQPRAYGLIEVVWSEVLGIDRLASSDDFFSLGGDSLAAMEVISKLRHRGHRAEILHLYEAPTLAAFANLTGKANATERFDGEVLLPPYVQVHLNSHENFLQSVRFEVANTISELTSAMHAVVDAHPVLAMAIRLSQDGWLLSTDAVHHVQGEEVSEPGLLEVSAMAAVGTDRLMAWSMWQGPDSVEVCWVSHHAVIDNQSWIVLLTDLELALDGSLSAYEEYHYPKFCHDVTENHRSETASLAPVVGDPVVWNFQLSTRELVDSDVEVAVLGPVARRVAAGLSRSRLALGVERDLRFSSGGHGQGIGCYVDFESAWLIVEGSEANLLERTKKALHSAKRNSIATSCDIIVNRNAPHPTPLGASKILRVLTPASLGRHNAASSPALVTIDLMIDSGQVDVQIAVKGEELAQSLNNVEVDISLALEQLQPAIEGADLVEIDVAALIERLEGR